MDLSHDGTSMNEIRAAPLTIPPNAVCRQRGARVASQRGLILPDGKSIVSQCAISEKAKSENTEHCGLCAGKNQIAIKDF